MVNKMKPNNDDNQIYFFIEICSFYLTYCSGVKKYFCFGNLKIKYEIYNNYLK